MPFLIETSYMFGYAAVLCAYIVSFILRTLFYCFATGITLFLVGRAF